MHQARFYHTLVATSDNLYAIGGMSGDCSVLDSVEVYNVATNQWRKGTPMVPKDISLSSFNVAIF